MAWIVLNGPLGKRRVPENTPYRLLEGEEVIGSEADHVEMELNEELAQHGLLLGDAVAKLVKLSKLDRVFKKRNCTACSERQRILNEARTLGVKETVRQIVNTFHETKQ